MKAMPRKISANTDLLRRWVDTWHRAGIQLESIRRAEIESIDTPEAIRQIFGGPDLVGCQAVPPTSGLIEQQAWFARLRPSRGSR
jgi:hypothetical protein